MASIISAGTTSGTSLNLSADTSGVLQLATNGTTTAVTIDTSQNVGIGTSSPTFSAGGGLNVANSTFATLRARGGSSTGTDFAGGSDGKGYVYVRDNADLIIGTNNTERMRIDSSGNVLIGQSSLINNEKLLVRDNIAASANARIRNDSTSASAGAAIAMNASGNVWGIECGSSAKNSNALTWLLDYGGTNAERLRLNTDGTLILRGGSTSATGTGITFPATQSASSDANTLDDYEEGTFTPIAYGLSSAGTTTYSSQVGSYTKIGNLVTVNFSINVASMTGTGALALGGFPFTAAVNNNGSAPVMLENLDWGGGSYVQMYMGESRTYAIPYYMTDNSGWSAQQVNNEQFAAIFTLSYRV